jgi:hypothetical protein
VAFHTLQFELDLDAGGMLPQGEPLASYLVPGSRAPELQSDLDTIAVATNRLVSLRDQVTSLRQTLQTDTRDYLAGIKATDQSDQNDRAIAVKKLLDMQALYAERKLEFQKEIASLQLSLQDPLPVLDQKVSLRQEAITRYENDITKLESAIHQLQQEVYTATQERRGTVDRMESSYHQAAQASLQSMTNAAAQLREQFRAVNTLIQAYNGKLKRYGVQQP